MDAQQTGWFFSALGLALMLVQLLLVDRLERWLGADKTLWAAMFAVAGATAVLGLASEPWMAFAAIAPFALANGLIDPMIMSLLSKSADDDQQGRIQGVRGSVDSLGRTVPPFLAGPIAAAGAANWAVLTGAGLMAAGGLVALRFLGGGHGSQEIAGDRDTEAEKAGARENKSGGASAKRPTGRQEVPGASKRARPIDTDEQAAPNAATDCADGERAT